MPNLTVDQQTDPLISSENVTVNPSPHNFSKSILIGILIFVLLSLTAYGAFRYGQSVMTTKVTPETSSSTEKVSPFSNVSSQEPTPTPIEEMASWKTYKNESLGFELQYPSSLEVVDNTVNRRNDYIESDKRCLEHGGCGGGPRPSWVIDFLSLSDKQKIAANNPLFRERPYQFSLSVYQGISLNILYGEKDPAGYEQYPKHLTDYVIGGQIGLRNIQKGSFQFGQNPYLLYGVDYKGRVYSFEFPDKNPSVQDLDYTNQILSTFKFLN